MMTMMTTTTTMPTTAMMLMMMMRLGHGRIVESYCEAGEKEAAAPLDATARTRKHAAHEP